MIHYKSAEEIELMRKPNEVVAELLLKLESMVEPGVTTLELDDFAEDFIVKKGGKPAFLGYRGYPKTLCTSVNEQIVHGIPSASVVLKEGDIVGIDVGAIIDGWYGDSARTFPVGKISSEDEKLLKTTEKALRKAINTLEEAERLSDVSYEIEKLATDEGYSVVREYTGHGIGREMHESPQVLNYGKPGHGPKLRPGMVIAIEPMLNIGTWQTEVLEDGWTVVTADGRNSAHFEDTVALTENGPIVLSKIER